MASPSTVPPRFTRSADKEQPSLPPLVTSPHPRRTSSTRSTSWATRRTSSHSPKPRMSLTSQSRPDSYVYPIFHSSLSYALVRDFAYPYDHPLHYGAPPQESGAQSPVEESRRLSDPGLQTWDDSRPSWPSSAPWSTDDTDYGSKARDRLPAMSFQDDGPPYSEDDDLHSPIVTTTRNKKHKTSAGHERTRSPGGSRIDGTGYLSAANAMSGYKFSEGDGPGDSIVEDGRPENYQPLHRDSHFARPMYSTRDVDLARKPQDEEQYSDADGDEDDENDHYSKDYSFTIASPDEEMHGKAVALFNFESEHQNELPLREGQIILVSYRHGQGWLVAEDPRTGESGLVPEEFVRLLRDIEGGLSGLQSVNLAQEEADILSPLQEENTAPNLPPTQAGSRLSNGGNMMAEKHPPVRSNFSTSSRDFNTYSLPAKADEHGGIQPESARGEVKRQSLIR